MAINKTLELRMPNLPDDRAGETPIISRVGAGLRINGPNVNNKGGIYLIILWADNCIELEVFCKLTGEPLPYLSWANEDNDNRPMRFPNIALCNFRCCVLS